MKIRRLALYTFVVLILAGGIFLAWRRPTIAGIKRHLNAALVTAVAYANPPKKDPTIQMAPIPFDRHIIDPDISGDVKLVGDIDGDGFPDLIVGGQPQEKLNWYRYPDWQKTVIATPNNEFTTDGRLGDVNGDGSLDIVVPDGDGPDNLVWFENPRPSGDPATDTWVRHTIGTVGSWGKDVHVSDFDDNGLLDVATRRDTAVMVFFQMAPDSWTKMEFTNVDTGHEGMTSGDVDSDGHVDLVVHGQWVRNPGGDAARDPANWTPYDIGPADPDFKALVADINQDGHMDVLFSSSENTADVNWWSADNGDPTSTWTKHTILPMMERTHTLQAADMNLDGKMDVVLGQMHTSQANEIMVMINLDGQGTSWEKQLVDTGGLHNGVVADIGNDGDYDIFGANWTGNPPVRLWENRLDAAGSLDRWTYKQVTDKNAQTFGLGFGDVDGDGRQDIVSGRYWYHNPGGDMLGDWTQHEFPDGMHAFMVLNVDGDNLADVMAQKDESGLAVYWLEATDETATNWTAVKVGTVESASHELGAQGYRTAVLTPGGPPVVAISSGNGIYYFQIPDNPAAGDWPKVHVSSNPSDEGFAFGDINGDGQLDIAGTTGDSKRVEWYLNPGDGSGEWTAYPVGAFDEALYPDRTEVADLNGDGRLDVIVTEENGEDNDAQTFWWEQPADPTAGEWTRHLLTTQATTNSLDVADMNGDGSTDVVLAEHRGGLKLAIWVNDGQGNFTEQVVSTGKESHLGAQTVDLDGDGDLDIVSIAWDAPQFIHLWRNDELGHGATSSAAPAASAADVETPVPPAADNATAPQTVPETAVAGQGLLALYTFNEGAGDTVHDVSGVGAPLDLVVADEAALTWLPSGGLQITAPTILASAGPAQKVVEAAKATNELTIEAWIKPADVEQDGPARIATISFDPFNRNLTLGQEFGAYDVRLRTSDTSENGVPSLSTPDGVVEPALVHLVYTRDAAGQATIYRDGQVVAQSAISGALSGWDDTFRLALANELSMDRPWLGEYHAVAFYDRALSADEVAGHFQAGPDVVLAAPTPAATQVEVESAPAAGSEPADTGTAVAQSAPAVAATAVESLATAVPTVEAAQAPASSSLIPLGLIGGVLAIIVVVIVVAWNRRGRQSS